MRRSEMQALGQLAGEALAAGGALIEQMHAGIAERAFGQAPPTPARAIHDGVSRAVYAGVRSGLHAAARAGGQLAARRAPAHAPSLADATHGALALGALHGIYGSHVAERVPELAGGMEIRRRGLPVPVDAQAV